MDDEEKRIMLDCSKLPSDNNCKLKISAPESQKEDLIDAGVAHAVKTHGHDDTPELRDGTEKMIEPA